MANKQYTATEDLAEILIKAIKDEPYFNSETLKPKIVALIKSFRITLSAQNFNKKETPSRLAKLMRANELKNKECIFWRDKVKNMHPEKIETFYTELRSARETWEAPNKINQ